MPHRVHITPRHRFLLPAFILLSLILAGCALLCASPGELAQGLWYIVTHEDVLITDYIQTAGLGPALFNCALVTLASVALIWWTEEPPNGFTVVTLSLMCGFALFGKNLVNIWPIIAGGYLYARLKKEPYGRYVNVSLLATSLAPVVSFMGCQVHPLLGILLGLGIGFLTPPVSEYAFRIQNGMNLYSLGFTCGLMAMVLVPVFKALGLDPAPNASWSTGNNLILGTGVAILCVGCILLGLLPHPRRTLALYRQLLHTTGRSPSDFLRVFGSRPVLVNMGLNGLLGMGYLLLIHGDLNGPTLGALFTIIGFSAYGKHPRNILPVMAGVWVGSMLNHVPTNAHSLQLAGLFGTTLAPFSTFFGWPFGVLAGLLHSSVVLQSGLPLEGMNLYHNGFSGGLVAIVLYPILTSLLRHRRPTLQNEDLFQVFESDEPQAVAQLDIHRNDDIQMPR